MSINLFILILTIVIMIIITVYCTVKNPRFPMMTLSFSLLYGFYLAVAFLINDAMYSQTDHILPENILFSVVGFLTMSDDMSYFHLESAFYQYALVIIILTCINIVVFISDIKRIFFKKEYLFKDEHNENT